MDVDPPSSDASVAGAEADVLLDEFLVKCLGSSRDVAPLLAMERDLEAFLADSSRTKHCFPPASSYLRLMAHRVCQHFHLRHAVATLGAEGTKAVCAFKTPSTRLPPLRLADLVGAAVDSGALCSSPAAPASAAADSEARVVLLRRSPSTASATSLDSSSCSSPAPRLSSSLDADADMLEREAKYLEAKLRIFGGAEAMEEADAQVPVFSSPPPLPKSPPRDHQTVDLFADSPALPHRPLSVTPVLSEFVPGVGLVRAPTSPAAAAASSSSPPPPSLEPLPHSPPPAQPQPPPFLQEYRRPPPRSGGRLFDPNARAYSPPSSAPASTRGSSQSGSRISTPPKSPTLPVAKSPPKSPPKSPSLTPKPSPPTVRLLATPHVRIASAGATVDAVALLCTPLGARSVRVGDSGCVVAVFASALDAVRAEAAAAQQGNFSLSVGRTLVTITDPNAGK